MADEQDQNQDAPVGVGAAAAPTRPDTLPESYWDGEKNAPKYDAIGTALTELDSLRPLKTAADERAAKIPAKPDDYKFDLPKDFELPAGFAWQADPKEPLVAAFRDYAVANKLTQDEVNGIVSVYAKSQADEIKARTAFDAEQTKLLGDKANERRTAAQTWIGSIVSPQQAGMFAPMLVYKDGVEAIESLMDKSGVKPRGTPGGEAPENENADLKENIGKAGTASAILHAAHSAAK